jgi:hypothetical protein
MDRMCTQERADRGIRPLTSAVAAALFATLAAALVVARTALAVHILRPAAIVTLLRAGALVLLALITSTTLPLLTALPIVSGASLIALPLMTALSLVLISHVFLLCRCRRQGRSKAHARQSTQTVDRCVARRD